MIEQLDAPTVQANRQDFLERALDWVSKGDIGGYMSSHRTKGATSMS
jgi:hypothetical protein